MKYNLGWRTELTLFSSSKQTLDRPGTRKHQPREVSQLNYRRSVLTRSEFAYDVDGC